MFAHTATRAPARWTRGSIRPAAWAGCDHGCWPASGCQSSRWHEPGGWDPFTHEGAPGGQGLTCPAGGGWNDAMRFLVALSGSQGTWSVSSRKQGACAVEILGTTHRMSLRGRRPRSLLIPIHFPVWGREYVSIRSVGNTGIPHSYWACEDVSCNVFCGRPLTIAGAQTRGPSRSSQVCSISGGNRIRKVRFHRPHPVCPTPNPRAAQARCRRRPQQSAGGFLPP